MDATDASERHNFLSLDAFPENVFRTVVIALRVALEEIILWVLEEEPVDCAAESTVRPHDSVERNLGLVSHSLQVIADCVDSLTERMAVWKEDQRVGPCFMSDSFPLGEMKVRTEGCPSRSVAGRRGVRPGAAQEDGGVPGRMAQWQSQ